MDYSSGEFFHYSYDAAGNRLTQDTHEGTNTYRYDAKHRITKVDGVAYSWDPACNLLSDGERTFTYDHADHLTSVTDGSSNYAFAYDGLGNRYQQSIDGTTTSYSLDIAADLTQVLGDGTNAYLYGLGHIGEDGAGGWQYSLPDALGSVRQLSDPSASITLSQSFEPFGAPLKAYGDGSSEFGFTGEQDEIAGLVFLRARYYDPSIGRFISKDTFPGVLSLPSTLHPFQYAFNNPINLVDPSGEIIPAILGALIIGAIIGGIGGGINFVLSNQGMSLGDMFSSGCFWRSVGIGAAVGAIAGLEGWVVPYWLPFIGINVQAGFGAAILGGSITGSIASGVGQIANNLLCGEKWSKGIGWALLTGGVTGGIAGGIGYGIRKGIQLLLTRRLQSLTNLANQRLSQDPSIARGILYRAEYISGQSSPRTAPMNYGKAIERMVAQQIRESPLDRLVFNYVAGPNNPDFVNKAIASGFNFDITTPQQIAAHLKRPYGPGLNIVIYTRPENFLVFP